MRIAIVGGIYGKDEQHRAIAKITPETTLENGLRTRGCDVETFSHYSKLEGRNFNVIHVHHLSYGAIRASGDTSDAAFVYTSHDGPAMSGLPRSSFRRLAARFVMSRADGVVALSNREADFQRRVYPMEGAAHSVIPNGIDLRNYSCVRHNAAGKGQPWKILYAGQLIGSKNVDVLVRALPLVKHNTELDLAYHNPAMEASLRRLAAGLGLSERIHFLGPKPPHELAMIYQQADIFILPSAGEALPSVVTEAMACGTPIVATDVGGVREQLGEYGLVVRPNRVDELAAAIEQMLDNYERFASRGEEMSLYVRRRFSIESMIDGHLELYSELLRQKGPRRRNRFFGWPINVAMKVGTNLLCATK